jgi:hypothetical protein
MTQPWKCTSIGQASHEGDPDSKRREFDATSQESSKEIAAIFNMPLMQNLTKTLQEKKAIGQYHS